MNVRRLGSGSSRIGIVGCLHGDEPLGREIIESLRDGLIVGAELVLLVANEEAMRAGARFLETDLNRSFPGSDGGTHEERLARRVLAALRGCDLVIDIHTTTADTEAFIITVDDVAVVERAARAMPLRKVVRMSPALASGHSLIDHVPGISLEFPRSADARDALRLITCGITAFLEGRSAEGKEWYVGRGILRGDAVLENFALVAQGTIIEGSRVEEPFYPVLSGERAYPGVCCIMASRMS